MFETFLFIVLTVLGGWGAYRAFAKPLLNEVEAEKEAARLEADRLLMKDLRDAYIPPVDVMPVTEKELEELLVPVKPTVKPVRKRKAKKISVKKQDKDWY